jgi:ATP-binding cassette subfamily B protein
VNRFRHVWPWIHQHRWLVLLGIASVLIENLLVLAAPLLFKRSVDSLTAGALWACTGWAVLRIGLMAALGLPQFGWRWGIAGTGRSTEYYLRSRLFEKLSSQTQAFFRRWKQGNLMSRASSDVGAVREFTANGLRQTVSSLSMIPMTLWAMGRLDWQVTFLCLLPLAAMPILIISLGPVVNRLGRQAQDMLDPLSQAATESFAGIRVIQAYGQQESEATRFGAVCREYRRKNLKVEALRALYWPLLMALSGFSMVLLFWKGGEKVVNHAITLGTFVALTDYLGRLAGPFMSLGFTTNMYQRGKVSVDRLNEVLDEQPDITSGVQTGGLSHLPSDPVLTFEGVGLQYPGGLWALQGISFNLKPGEWLGLAGRTGSGKTTLLGLPLRLHDPQEGQVRVEGRPVKEWDLASLRRRMGYVSQETFLFSDSIGANVAFGRPDSSHEEVVRAARAAGLHEAIAEFPSAYETLLGERGVNLSGGQKQRLALGRALLLKPRLLLLDDAFSAVDSAMEERILSGLKEALPATAVILVSHRISTLRACERMLVLDQGRLAEQGTHQELLAHEGYYFRAALREQQAAKAGLAV